VPKRGHQYTPPFSASLTGEPIWTGNGVVGRSIQPFWLRRVWQIASAIVWFCRLGWQITTSRQFGAANQDLISITPVLYHPFRFPSDPRQRPTDLPWNRFDAQRQRGFQRKIPPCGACRPCSCFWGLRRCILLTQGSAIRVHHVAMSRAGTHRRDRLDLWYCDRLDRARCRVSTRPICYSCLIARSWSAADCNAVGSGSSQWLYRPFAAKFGRRFLNVSHIR
jgi:hypothetical protein